MNKLSIKGLIVCAALSITSAAFAYEDTVYFKIDRLEGSSASGDSYRVYPAGYALPTLGCAQGDFAEVEVWGPVGAEKQKMSRLLLAAFTAGRKVKLRLDGCGATGRPAYRIVTMDADQ